MEGGSIVYNTLCTWRSGLTYYGVIIAVCLRMIPVDLALVQIYEIHALRGWVPVRTFTEFESRSHPFHDGILRTQKYASVRD